MHIGVIAIGCQETGKSLIAGRMFGQSMIDLHNTACRAGCQHVANGEGGAGGAWVGGGRKIAHLPIGHGLRGKSKGNDDLTPDVPS